MEIIRIAVITCTILIVSLNIVLFFNKNSNNE